MERYGLAEPISLRLLNSLNELTRSCEFIERFYVRGNRGRILEVHLTDAGAQLDDPDPAIREFLGSHIGLVPEHHYETRLAA